MSAEKLYKAKWGIFNHFLYDAPGGSTMTVRNRDMSWNERVNLLDTDKIAENLHEMGAGYYFITLMQGRKYMLAPNGAFDRIAGIRAGEACAERDVITELYRSLSKYGIDLYLYFTGDGPYKDVDVGLKFGFVEPRKNVSDIFVSK